MNRIAEHCTKWLSRGGTALLFLALLAGCHTDRQPSPDRSILTDDPCAAPCWQGIIPGETTSTEAGAILATLGFIDPDDFWSHGNDFRWRTSASEKDPAMVSEVQSHDGVVVFMKIGIDFQLSLQEVLDKYGSPEKLLAYQGGVEIINTHIHFYYPQQGLIFVSRADPVPPSEPFMLEATTPIVMVYYFVPTSMDRLFDDLPQYARRLRFGEEYLLDWQGLGPIDVQE